MPIVVRGRGGAGPGSRVRRVGGGVLGVVIVLATAAAFPSPASGEEQASPPCGPWPSVPCATEGHDDAPQGESSSTDVNPWRERPLSIEGHLSLGGPLGLGGAAIGYSVREFLGVTLGAGATTSGAQLGSWVTARVSPISQLALGLELGASGGRHIQSAGGGTAQGHPCGGPGPGGETSRPPSRAGRRVGSCCASISASLRCSTQAVQTARMTSSSQESGSSSLESLLAMH